MLNTVKNDLADVLSIKPFIRALFLGKEQAWYDWIKISLKERHGKSHYCMYKQQKILKKKKELKLNYFWIVSIVFEG